MAWYEYVWFPYTVSSYLYHRAFPDKPKGQPVNVSSIPRTDEGAPLPLLYGRCRVTSPAVIWLGNWIVRPSSGSANAYFVDILFAIGIPFYGGGPTAGASLLDVLAGDVSLQINEQSLYFHSLADGVATASFIHLNAGLAPGIEIFRTGSSAAVMFGGPGAGGGIDSNIEFYRGLSNQVTSDYVNDVDPESRTYLQRRMTLAKWSSIYDHPELIDETLMPGYRNQVMAFMEINLGEQPNFTSYSFEVLALSTGTSSDMGQSLANEADPAAVIFDLLTSPWSKLGIPISSVDVDSFVNSSVTLVIEGHGYSRAIEQPRDAVEIIDEILRQIDGMYYVEPTTGKIVLALVRFDYIVEDLEDINPDNAEPGGAGWYQVQGWNETYNQCRVTFTDRQNNYADGIRIAQSGANATVQNARGLRSFDVHVPGCCDEAIARKIAARELAVKSRPMVKVTVVVDRRFYLARPGSVYTFTWPELGVDHMVMRVTHVDFGQLHNGAITLSMIRDVFDVSIGAFPAP